MRILIIEDDPLISETLELALSGHYLVDVADTGTTGLYKARVNEYALILLDLGLPDLSGEMICRTLRTEDIRTPILIITGRNETTEKVAALDAGADDYLVKPFTIDELLARVRALLRRSPDIFTPELLIAGALRLDTSSRTVIHGTTQIPLRRKEFDLLEFLLRNKGMVVTRSMIIDHIWNDESPYSNAVDVHIKYLRDRIDRPFQTHIIRTIRGVGYSIAKN